jgi:hypothetical protein
MKVTIFHNVQRDGFGHPVGMVDGRLQRSRKPTGRRVICADGCTRSGTRWRRRSHQVANLLNLEGKGVIPLAT